MRERFEPRGDVVPGQGPMPAYRPVFVGVVLLFLLGGVTQAQVLRGGESRSWQRAVTDEMLTLTLFRPEGMASNAALPVVFYLQNLGAPRVGGEGDDAILQDFHQSGYLVVTVDFASRTNARTPYLNRDLGKLRDDLQAKKLLADFTVDMAHVFLVPQGCRLERDVVFYPDAKRTLAMDVIYPSQPVHPVGAVIEFSCDNKDRFGNYSLSVCSDTLLDGFATEGFAVAMADHPVPPPYKGLDPMPDCALKIKAAVRTLRVEGEPLGFNGRIVPVGFSRGSGMALMLVTTAGMEAFEGAGENAGVSSDVQGAVVMSGRFTYLDLLPDDHMLPRYAKAWGERATALDVWRRHGALDYLTKPPGYPLFLSINCTESPDALHQMEVLRKRIQALGGKADFHMDNEPRGHKVPLDPQILGAMRDYLRQSLRTP